MKGLSEPIDQMELLAPEPEGGEVEGIGAAVPSAFPSPKRGPGRPAGAVNKKTASLERYWAARGYRDPLAFLGDLVSSDAVELWQWFREETRRATGSVEGAPTLLDVVDLQRKAATDAAPYLHGKMPVRGEDGNARLPFLVINTGTNQVERRAAGVGRLSIGRPVEVEQDQGVSDDER